MAEDALHSAPAVSAEPPDPTRGLPYYEKLRRDLRDMLQKKRQLDKHLATLDDSIYRLETSYLEETTAGNIIKGFDSYIKSSVPSGSNSTSMSRKKATVNEHDRVFSRSSASFLKDLEVGTPSSAHTTPAPTPGSTKEKERDDDTPTSAGGMASLAGGSVGTGLKGNKKKKAIAAAAAAVAAAPEEEDDEVPGKKRARISFSGGRGGD